VDFSALRLLCAGKTFFFRVNISFCN
jgi:hypothetical protein